jgi:NaMN:DMB phosphoribosyltransferase
MEELTILRTFAAVTTVLAAALVAANWNARITVAGFVIFIAASLAWMADGWLESKTIAGHPERHPPPDQRARCLALASQG